MPLRMKSGERRQAILEAAIALFAENGFRGTTTRRLAAAVGVTEPVLYQHFRTKQELYGAIIEAKAGQAAERASKLRKAAEEGTDEEFLTMLAQLILRRYEEDPEMSRLLLFSCLERHEMSGLFFDRLFQEFNKVVTGYLRKRIAEGAFREVSPEIAARSIIGAFAHQGLMRLLFPGKIAPPDRARIADETARMLLDGIRSSAHPDAGETRRPPTP